MMRRFLAWWRRTFWRHDWDRSRPYRRTCKVCGRYEVSHCQSMDTWHDAWWETFNEGDPSKHWKAK
jgi:hypothetical protein